MARYLATHSTYIEGRYVEASVAAPQIIELPDDVPPSKRFQPLDEEAVAALKKLGVTAKLAEPPKPPKGRKPAKDADTMSGMAGGGVKSAADRTPGRASDDEVV